MMLVPEGDFVNFEYGLLVFFIIFLVYHLKFDYFYDL